MNEIEKVVSRYYGEWREPFRQEQEKIDMPDSALLGNGDVGIASGGARGEKTFYISKGDFWVYGKGGKIHEPGQLLIGGITIREVMQSGKITQDRRAEFYEKQDIWHGEIDTRQSLEQARMEAVTWLSREKNLLITELILRSEYTAALQVELWAEDGGREFRPISAAHDAVSVTVTRSTEKRAGYEKDEKAWISKAALSAKVIGADDVRTDAEDSLGSAALTFSAAPGRRIFVVTAVGGGGRTYHYDGSLWEGKEPEEESRWLLEEVPDETAVRKLKEANRLWWENYWAASYIDLGVEDEVLNQVQKYYYGAQYILGSTVNEGKVAPGIYGVWRINDTPGWHGDYHMNYNFMSPFYGVCSANRPKLTLPAIEALFSYMPEGQRRASDVEELKAAEPYPGFVEQKIASGAIDPQDGIPGALLFPVGIGPWCSTPDAAYWKETLNAGYNAYLFTQYYEYTLDEAILPQAYEYLKKCAALYEVWLEQEDGRYNLYSGWCEGNAGLNPAVELAAIQHVFRNLLVYGRKLGADSDKWERWSKIYEDMTIKPTWDLEGIRVYGLAQKRLDNSGPEIGFDSNGALFSNVVMLDYFMPGDHLGYFSSPEELEAARNTIDFLDKNPKEKNAWNMMNNFPRVFTYAVRARYDIHKVMERFYENISDDRMAGNLRITDKYHGIEKCGATEAVNSMLLASDGQFVKLFPNWYPDKDAKFVNLRARGAFLVSASYDGSTGEAKDIMVFSEKGAQLTLVVPWKEQAMVRDSKGRVITTMEGSVPGWEADRTISFDTTAGEHYYVEKSGI